VVTEERDRTPPQEIRAEFAVLGSMMLSAEARNQVVNLLDPRDFYRDHHGALFSVMAEMDAAGEPVDGITVLAALRARGMLRAPTDANLLHSLVESVPTTANVAYYADQVRDAAVRRRIIEVGTRIVQAGYTADQGSGQDAAEWAHDQTAHLRDSRYYDDPGDAETLDGLLSVDAQYDWLIPGLVEKADRVMLTGGEGSGKSTLVRQIAVCVAAGLHPFTFTDTPPRCVMVVDLENGRSLSQRRSPRRASSSTYARPGST
jgi:replicative DNA helicase